jgi:alkylhydroperoxidase family enzyme
MARLQYLDKPDIAEEHRDLLDNPANLHRAMIYSPRSLRAMLNLGRHLRHRSELDGRLRELAILMVAYLMRSAYEWSHHLKLMPQFGVTNDDVSAVVALAEGGKAKVDSLTLAVLAAAQQLTVDGNIADGVFAVLKERLAPSQLVDLMLTISYYTGLARMISSLRIEVESSYEPYLAQFPLPKPWR